MSSACCGAFRPGGLRVRENCDCLIVGGGIHGVGVAQALAAAGHDVIVLEKKALAAGASGKSSKLIHGGLRYLESGNLALVRESLHERELLLRLAPELVKRTPFHLPVYGVNSRPAWQLRVGLGLYALLAGLGEGARFSALGRSCWDQLDGLCTEGLKTVFRYWDAQTDDAELTRAVMRSAASLGARLFCPALFLGAERSPSGFLVRVLMDGRESEVCARCIVNAAGAWAVGITGAFNPELGAAAVENVQGAHIELPGRIEGGCYYMEVPQDKRAVFVMPWKGRTLVGSTENLHHGSPDEVTPLAEETDYLLRVFRRYFPERPTEVLDSWAGLRVLPRSQAGPFGRSRETRLQVDGPPLSRVVSVYGGKLTAYRATAAKVLRLLVPSLPQRSPRADTRELILKPES
ncbi:MAG: FAD-dependent oxidoreductase [Planctomycetes bacterium]|nr:FAD-dependent oxidoreductase [Planctomycetota bacterium]